MTKYSGGEFKIDVVTEYHLGYTSNKTLAKKYYVGKSMIHVWVI
ncbi:MAG: hypothetical protein ABF575_09200 [Liquorilactobacillus hordei]